MSPDELIAKARSYVGVVTSYHMGADTRTQEDCSAFIWHVLGGQKDQHGTWWNTDRIYGDVTGPQVEFERLDAPEAGCWLVYGSRQNGGNAGHIALLVDPATWTIIDCSSSQHGVHEHDGAYWRHHAGAVWCRYRFPDAPAVDVTLNEATQTCEQDPDFCGPPACEA